MTNHEYTTQQLKATQQALKRMGYPSDETPQQRDQRLYTQREARRLKENLVRNGPTFQTADEVFEELIQLGLVPPPSEL